MSFASRDIVFIENLRVDAIIGVFDHEQLAPQPLRFDVELGFDCRKAGASDDLADTVDYAAVAALIENTARGIRCKLVEALAETLCAQILAQFPVRSVCLKIAKPAILPNADGVGVRIERMRDAAARA